MSHTAYVVVTYNRFMVCIQALISLPLSGGRAHFKTAMVCNPAHMRL